MIKVLPRRTSLRHFVPSGTGQHSIGINDQFRLVLLLVGR